MTSHRRTRTRKSPVWTSFCAPTKLPRVRTVCYQKISSSPCAPSPPQHLRAVMQHRCPPWDARASTKNASAIGSLLLNNQTWKTENFDVGATCRRIQLLTLPCPTSATAPLNPPYEH